MTFVASVPLPGYAGWQFLNRTMESQQEVLASSAKVSRETEYFRENIGKISTAEELTEDRTLLTVALGAFGLAEDIDNRYFIERVLGDGTLDDDSLANRLSDNRYLELSKAFGFGDFSTPRTKLSDFGEEIAALYETRSFEVSVGEQNTDFRLALGLERELPEIATRDVSEDTMWFSIMGSTALRTVFESALGLPSSFGSLDLDDQLSRFKDLMQSRFGDDSIRQFTDPEKRDELVRTFLIQSELKQSIESYSPGGTALTLLSGL